MKYYSMLQAQGTQWLEEALSPQAQDTAAADTLLQAPAVVDTTHDVVDVFGRSIEQAGTQLLAGEWELFWMNFYEGTADLLVDFIPNLIGAILVFAILFAAYRITHRVLNQLLARSPRMNTGLRSLLMKTFRTAAWIFIIVMVLDQFGFNVTALLAGLSIAGIAVAFAARDTLENFIAGVTIFLDRPFHVGHRINVNDTYGKVEEITLRSTRIRTLQDEIMVIPNSKLINQSLINHSFLGVLRIDVEFGIAYKESPNRAREIVLGLVAGDNRIDFTRPPTVVVTDLSDSSVDMALRFYLKNPDLEYPVRFEYKEKIFYALREGGIEIPFPHMQLFIDEAKAFQESFLMQSKLPVVNVGNSQQATRTES